MNTLKILEKLCEIQSQIRSMKTEIVDDLVKNHISWQKLAKYDKIEAIRLCRTNNGFTLMEAKGIIDHYLETGIDLSKEKELCTKCGKELHDEVHCVTCGKFDHPFNRADGTTSVGNGSISV